MEFKEGISVIISCYNSEKTIKYPILSLKRQKRDNIGFELIIVDNNSKDKTMEIIKELWDNDSTLKIVKEDKQGLIHARKRGVHEAKYSIILFLDDDNELIGDNWLNTLFELFGKMPDVGIIGGKVIGKPLAGNKLPVWFSEVENVYACGEQWKTEDFISYTRGYVFGAGLGIRTKIAKQILLKEQFFLVGRTKNKLLRGEDNEICQKALLHGWEIFYTPILKLNHYIAPKRLSFSYVMKARFGGGKAEFFIARYRNTFLSKKDYSDTMQLKKMAINSFSYKFITFLQKFSFFSGYLSQYLISRIDSKEKAKLNSLSRYFKRFNREYIEAGFSLKRNYQFLLQIYSFLKNTNKKIDLTFKNLPPLINKNFNLLLTLLTKNIPEYYIYNVILLATDILFKHNHPLPKNDILFTKKLLIEKLSSIEPRNDKTSIENKICFLKETLFYEIDKQKCNSEVFLEEKIKLLCYGVFLSDNIIILQQILNLIEMKNDIFSIYTVYYLNKLFSYLTMDSRYHIYVKRYIDLMKTKIKKLKIKGRTLNVLLLNLFSLSVKIDDKKNIKDFIDLIKKRIFILSASEKSSFFFYQGTLWYKKKNFKRALKFFKKVKKLIPNHKKAEEYIKMIKLTMEK